MYKLNFIRINYGNLINLLDTNDDYGVRYINNITYIYYFGDLLDEWELV